jgi:hypothetical protein
MAKLKALYASPEALVVWEAIKEIIAHMEASEGPYGRGRRCVSSLIG